MLQVKALREMIEDLPDTTLILVECGDMPVGPGKCDVKSVTVKSISVGFVLLLEVDPG